MANPFYGSGTLRSKDGLTSRPAAAFDDIQLQMNPVHADLDKHITGLRGKIRQFKGQMTLIKAQAGAKHNVRRINKKIIQQGSNHVAHVVLFALFCFFLVYLWSKYSKS